MSFVTSSTDVISVKCYLIEWSVPLSHITPNLGQEFIDGHHADNHFTLIYLHFENGWILRDINCFLVKSPAFYIVIGWLWGMSENKRTIKEHIKKRYKTLILPYVYFSLICLVLDIVWIACGLYSINLFLGDLYNTFCLRGIGTLWFLPVLLCGELLFIYLRDRKLWTRAIFIILALIVILCKSELNLYFKGYTFLSGPANTINDIFHSIIFIMFSYYFSKKWG